MSRRDRLKSATGPDELEDCLELLDSRVQAQICEGHLAYKRGKGRDLRVFLTELRRDCGVRRKKT